MGVKNYRFAKKILITIMALCLVPTSFAASTANIQLDIGNGNGHFMCFYGTGCLRMIEGKTYPMLHRVHAENIYVLNGRTFKVTPQPSHASCNVTVKRGQTLAISGRLDAQQRIAGLQCSIR